MNTASAVEMKATKRMNGVLPRSAKRAPKRWLYCKHRSATLTHRRLPGSF